MHTLHGIAVSPGVAIGEAFVWDNERQRVPRRPITPPQVSGELNRFRHALRASVAEMQRRRDAVSKELGPQYGAIFSAHLQMVEDPALVKAIEARICDELVSAEYAVHHSVRHYVRLIEQLGNGYMAERALDIYDIERLLVDQLVGERRDALIAHDQPIVLISHRLTPSETANLDRRNVLGFVTETGGAGGHTAIVAEAMEIPAVVGAASCLANVASGDMVIIDGDQGLVIVNPDETVLDKYRQALVRHQERMARLRPLGEMPARTLDGVHIQVLANIEFPGEVATCLERGADGVGLYRTEFLYLQGTCTPTEEEQYVAYRDVTRAMGGKPVTIRTVDLGADKLFHDPFREPEPNPFLGLRSIRVSLQDAAAFRTQLRAIVRASVEGEIRLMFPLISTLGQLREARAILDDVMHELELMHVPYDRNLSVGMMVEVPAVVVLLDHFLPYVDFLSIGTNDLIQYALAVDRSNPDVAQLYDAADPSVLRLIQLTLHAAAKRGVSVSLCGQMSANPIFAMLLVGLGLRQLSVPPHAIPEIKQLIRQCTLDHCKVVAEHAMRMESPTEIRTYLEDELRKVAPDLQVHVA